MDHCKSLEYQRSASWAGMVLARIDVSISRSQQKGGWWLGGVRVGAHHDESLSQGSSDLMSGNLITELSHYLCVATVPIELWRIALRLDHYMGLYGKISLIPLLFLFTFFWNRFVTPS